MKVGVTGATGFVGQHAVEALERDGHEVVGLVRRPADYRIGQRPEARPLDLANLSPDTLAAALDGLDAVVHAAAYLPASYASPAEARACLEINALGTLSLLEAAVTARVRHVLVFSSNVYKVTQDAVAEDAPIYPSTHAPYYMMSKVCADVWADHFDRTDRLAVGTLRVASVYGPGLARGMIETFVAKLSAGQTVTIQHGGLYRSDLVYVRDVAAATATAVTRAARGAFNIGSGTNTSSLDVARSIAELVGASPSQIEVLPSQGPAPSGFAPLDITRARRELGYRPHSLAEGLGEYVAWRRSHP